MLTIELYLLSKPVIPSSRTGLSRESSIEIQCKDNTNRGQKQIYPHYRRMHAGRHAERRRRFFCGETSPIPRKNIIFDLVLTKEAVYERKTRYRVAGRRDLSCRKSVRQAVGRTAGALGRAGTFGGRLLGRRGRVRLSDRPRGERKEYLAENIVCGCPALGRRRVRRGFRSAETAPPADTLSAPEDRHRLPGLSVVDRPQRVPEPLLRDAGHRLAKRKSDAVSTKYCNWSGWKPSTTRCRSNFRAESSNAW